jgi:hypothetical protein
MRSRAAIVVALLVTAVVVGGVQATADSSKSFHASLSGYEEVPALSVAGMGTFSANLSKGGQSLTFSLQYTGLTGDATAAHIHLGQPAVAAGVIAFLCGGGGQAACPTGTSGTVTGTIDASHVIGPEAQGIAPGEFAELLAALRAGVGYVNVHTAAFPPGEIRGQIG